MESSPLIGRESQVSELNDLLSNLEEEKAGPVVFISGEEGSGKSHLIRKVLGTSPFRVLVGRSYEGSHIPYQPFLEILNSDQSDPEDCKYHSENRLIHLLLAMAGEGPVCFLLEDLHWSDHATCEILPILWERISHEELFLMGVYRPEEIQRDHPIRKLRNELKRRGAYHEIESNPLNSKETLELTCSLIGGPPSRSLGNLIHEKTRGIPLYVHEFCDLLHSGNFLKETDSGLDLRAGVHLPVPEGIRDAILLKLNGLSEDSRTLIEAAAIEGLHLDFESLLSVEDLAGGLDELLDKRLLVESEPGYGRFRHGLLREAILEEIPWTRKRSLHQKFAESLKRRGAPTDVIAHHLLGAGRRDESRERFLEAANRAVSIGAYRDALVLHKQALELWNLDSNNEGRTEIVRKIAHAAQYTGQFAEAKVAWREILDSLSDQTPSALRAEAYSGLGAAYALQGWIDKAIPQHREAAQIYDRIEDPRKATLEWLESSNLLTLRARHSQSVSDADRAVALSRTLGEVGLIASSLGQRGAGLAMLGCHEKAQGDIEEALEYAIRSQDSHVLATIYQRLAYIHSYSASYRDAISNFQSAAEICHRNDHLDQAQFCMGCLAYAIMKTGDWKKAIQTCKEVLDDTGSAPYPRTVASGTLGLLSVLRGEKKKARKLFEECESLTREIGLHVMSFYYQWGWALIDEEEGREDSAVERYRRVFEIWEDSEDRLDVVFSLYTAAALFARQGLKKDLDRCTSILGEIVSHSANPEPQAALAYVCGEVEFLGGHCDAAIEYFIQAIGRLEKMGLPLETVFTSYRVGMVLIESGRQESAAEHLSRALRTAKKLGARPLAGKIAADMKSRRILMGGTRSKETALPDSISGLTRRQKEVANLLADGMTNKEIANQLYISPRTVDMHVGHLLDRLDCRTRSEATKKLIQMGEV